LSEYFEEEVLGKAYDARLMRRFLGYVRPHRPLVLLSFFLILLGIVFQLAGPVLLKEALDGPIRLGSIEGLWIFVVAFAGAIFAASAVEFLLTYVSNVAGQRIILDIRTRLFRHLQSLPVPFFDRNPVGRLVVRVTNDVENLNELFTSGLISFFGDLFVVLGVLGLMFYISWELSLVSMVIVPLLLGIVLVFRRFARERYREVRRRIARLNAYLAECIQGMRVVKMFNKQGRTQTRFEQLSDELTRETIGSVFLYSVFLPSIELASSLLTGLLIWYGAGEILQNRLTFGSFQAFWYCLIKLIQPLRDLSEKYNILQAAMASSERIFKILDTAPEPQGGAVPASIRGEIEFRNVTFSYDGTRNVLEDVSFHVRPGEKLAVVGFTGAGKTTLINLLLGFYELSQGQILLDGRPIQEYDRQALRRAFGWVSQDVFLFSGTIEENLRLSGRPADENWSRAVPVDRFVARFPKGYQTDVRERGVALSAGERQLISLSRALSFNPSVVILDEATSCIDMDTERLIQESTSRLLSGRTAVLIAHRLVTVRDADRIVVLHRGRVVEEGNHRDLLERRGVYEKLCRLQFQDAVRASPA
jgi:ATP-binding cassette subfamily B protein